MDQVEIKQYKEQLLNSLNNKYIQSIMQVDIYRQPLRIIQLPSVYIYYAKFSYDGNKVLILSRITGKSQTKINIYTIREQRELEFINNSEVASVSFCSDNIRLAEYIEYEGTIHIRNMNNYSLLQKIHSDLLAHIDRSWLEKQNIRCLHERFSINVQFGTWTEIKDLQRFAIVKQSFFVRQQINIFDRVNFMARSAGYPLVTIIQSRQNKTIKRTFCKYNLEEFIKHDTEQLYFTAEQMDHCYMRNKKGKILRQFNDTLKIIGQFKNNFQNIKQACESYLYAKFEQQIAKINITTGSYELIAKSRFGCVTANRQYLAVQDEQIIKIYEQ